MHHVDSGRSGTFGDFVALAAQLMPPAEPVLKTPDRFVYIGRQVPKLDTRAKTDGSAQYTLDVYRDDMLVAVVAHPPKFGATVASFDDAAARQVRGVIDVRGTDFGVAVYATGTWAALRGGQALAVRWNEAAAELRSTAATESDARAGAQPAVAAERGGRRRARGGHRDRGRVYLPTSLTRRPSRSMRSSSAAATSSRSGWAARSRLPTRWSSRRSAA